MGGDLIHVLESLVVSEDVEGVSSRDTGGGA